MQGSTWRPHAWVSSEPVGRAGQELGGVGSAMAALLPPAQAVLYVRVRTGTH